MTTGGERRSAYTRRGFVLGSAAFLIGGCNRRGEQADDGPPPPTADYNKMVLSRDSALPGAAHGGTWYDVVRGDTLSSVSRRSGVAVETIIDANKLRSNVLAPGTRLWLPGAYRLNGDATAAKPLEEPDQDFSPIRGGAYVLVPRSAWAREAVAENHQPMGGVSRMTLHHTGEHEGLEGLSDVEILRRIEHYHIHERHWAAIGYHFIIGKDAKVYEGRPVKYQGAHVSGDNSNNIGISVSGDFNIHLPSQRQLLAITGFLDELRGRYKLSKSKVFGHRDLNPSVCPGNALYAWLQRYKRAG